MDRTATGSSQPTRSRPPRRPRQPDRPGQPPRRWSSRALVLLIEAVFAGVGGVYLTTGSVTITVVAAGLAAVTVTLLLVTQR